MVKVGDVALKTAGRDAGNLCVLVDILDEKYAVVDGNVRRRKCNMKHLVFLGKDVSLGKNSTRQDILNALKKSGFKFEEIKKGAKREKKTQESTKTTVEASEKKEKPSNVKTNKGEKAKEGKK